MNVKRFVGRNSREAMQKVRLAFGDNAVVLSTKPCSEGIEVLAMPPETLEAIERMGQNTPSASVAPASSSGSGNDAVGREFVERHERDDRRARADRHESHEPREPHSRRAAARADAQEAPAAPRRARSAEGRSSSLRDRLAEQEARSSLDSSADSSLAAAVQQDVGTLAMSTLSFQDYVRERMLKKRQAELREQAMKPVPVSPQAIEQRLAQRSAAPLPSYTELAAAAAAQGLAQEARGGRGTAAQAARAVPVGNEPQELEADSPHPAAFADSLLLASEVPAITAAPGSPAAPATARAKGSPRRHAASTAEADAAEATGSGRAGVPAAAGDARQQSDMMNEIRAMKGLIEERFGALAFMERLQKSPKQAQLTTRLLGCGFSPALIRKLVDGLSDEVVDELAWAGEVLQRNLLTGEADAALEDQGGVYALIGSTGVGKTTSTAKLAAAFATRHGAANLGLITLDAYRLGAHEQLRAYGRILGVPVHTAHDRVALEDLLDLLSAKKMVLIDTAGLAQRDSRTRELLEMLSHPSIQRLLVVNAAQQGETIEDVLVSYKATQAKGIVLSKLDEAVKLGPALDALIRHRLKVVAVANGQRVPEDWHRLTAQALLHRALRSVSPQAWTMDANDVNLLFATPPVPAPRRGRAAAAGPAR